MKKICVLTAAVLIAVFFTAAAEADMAAYLNGGVANLNPTIGLNGEFQYGYASVALGAGVMALNDFGFGIGLRGYLFGLNGGPYLEAIYGTTAEKPIMHTDSGGKEVIDDVIVIRGISGLAGWRFFFGDGWNMTMGAGAAQAENKAIFVFNLTAGIMIWGDEAAQKNAEKYGKSFKPPEPGLDSIEPEMPGQDEGLEPGMPGDEMLDEAVLITPPAEAAIPAEIEIAAAAEAVTPAAQAITPAAKTAAPAAKPAKPAAKAAAAPAKVTGTAKAK